MPAYGSVFQDAVISTVKLSVAINDYFTTPSPMGNLDSRPSMFFGRVLAAFLPLFPGERL